MKQKLMRWLQPPVFEGDDTKTSRAGLLNEVILVSIVIVALFTFSSLLGNNTTTSSRIIAALLALLLALSWRMFRSGKITFIAFAMPIAVFIAYTGAIISLGTIRTPMAAGYSFLIVLVVLLFRLPGILVATIASSLAIDRKSVV